MLISILGCLVFLRAGGAALVDDLCQGMDVVAQFVDGIWGEIWPGLIPQMN